MIIYLYTVHTLLAFIASLGYISVGIIILIIITISNTEIQNINTYSLRDTQSYLTQETVLFNESIEDNIKIAKLDAMEHEIIEACK